jgi:hypothetical protein
MKGTNIFIGEENLTTTVAYRDSGKFIPARPIGYISFFFTLKCAWKVLLHKADIVIWKDKRNS